MESKRGKKSVKGTVVTDGRTLDVHIPKKMIEIFRGEPRLIFKKLEWYGIHPVPIQMLSKELQEMNKDYMFIAVPNEMMK